jgi:hypothetical protein
LVPSGLATRGLTTSVARPPFSEIVRSRFVWRPAPPTRSRRLSGDQANVKGSQMAVHPPGREKRRRRWRPFTRSTMIPARVVQASIERSGDQAAEDSVNCGPWTTRSRRPRASTTSIIDLYFGLTTATIR